MKFLLYALIAIVLSFSFICVKLAFHAPDHLHAYAAAVGSLAGLLVVVFKLLPLVNQNDTNDLPDIDNSTE